MNVEAWRSIALAMAALLCAMPLFAQECHDWDGDEAAAGWECAAETDCADRSWARSPDGLETCNALDDDCDATFDEGCDRWCDAPFHILTRKELPIDGLVHFSKAAVARTDRGVLVAAGMQEEGEFDNNLSRIFMRAYDDSGVSWDEAHEMTAEGAERPLHNRVRVASAGDRTLVVWLDNRPELVARILRARVVDDLGNPMNQAWDLSSQTGNEPTISGLSAVWDGDRFVVFWTGVSGAGALYMSVLSVDGQSESPDSSLVTEDASGEGWKIGSPVAFWTGEHYLVFFNAEVDGFRVLKVSWGGQVLGPATSVPGSWNTPDGVLAVDRIAVSWADWSRLAPEFAYLAFFDLDGALLDPPGIVPLYTSVLDDEDKHDVTVTWTGEMYVVAMYTARLEGILDYRYRWIMWRVLPDGTVLDPNGYVISDATHLRPLHQILWSGEELWLFGAREKTSSDQWALFWERIVCSCEDADGDGHNSCTTDCDDSEFDVHQFGQEHCRGQLDEDCDGLIDCADAQDCPGAVGPAAVAHLQWDAQGLVWEVIAGAQRFDVARGLVSDRNRRGDFLQAECAGWEVVGTFWRDDGRRPPTEDALWYLVRPEGEPCALGPWAVDVVREVNACR